MHIGVHWRVSFRSASHTWRASCPVLKKSPCVILQIVQRWSVVVTSFRVKTSHDKHCPKEALAVFCSLLVKSSCQQAIDKDSNNRLTKKEFLQAFRRGDIPCFCLKSKQTLCVLFTLDSDPCNAEVATTIVVMIWLEAKKRRKAGQKEKIDKKGMTLKQTWEESMDCWEAVKEAQTKKDGCIGVNDFHEAWLASERNGEMRAGVPFDPKTEAASWACTCASFADQVPETAKSSVPLLSNETRGICSHAPDANALCDTLCDVNLGHNHVLSKIWKGPVDAWRVLCDGCSELARLVSMSKRCFKLEVNWNVGSHQGARSKSILRNRLQKSSEENAEKAASLVILAADTFQKLLLSRSQNCLNVHHEPRLKEESNGQWLHSMHDAMKSKLGMTQRTMCDNQSSAMGCEPETSNRSQVQWNQEGEACDGGKSDWRTAARLSSRTTVRRKAPSISLSVEGTPDLAHAVRTCQHPVGGEHPASKTHFGQNSFWAKSAPSDFLRFLSPQLANPRICMDSTSSLAFQARYAQQCAPDPRGRQASTCTQQRLSAKIIARTACHMPDFFETKTDLRSTPMISEVSRIVVAISKVSDVF
eukprot:jgi/Bigna1/82034/fgenesh1_pg.87_\